jgi:hypothetical protein
MALRSSAPEFLRVTWRSAVAVALFAAGFLLAGQAVQAATPAIVLASDDPADPLAPFGDRLKHGLSPSVTATLQSTSSGPAVLAAVLADRNRIAFAQRDGLAAFRSLNESARSGLEFYGDVPACAVALVRRDSPVRSHADLVAARRGAETVTFDVGSADDWTATTLAILRSLDVALAHPRLEHRGGARALSRVLAGETDVMVVMAYGATLDPALTDALTSGALEPAPFFNAHLLKLASLHGLPYSAGRVEIPGPGLLRTTRHETICTTLGVVVNAGADRAVSETIARLTVNGGLSRTPRQWFDNALATATNALGLAISEAKRVATAVAEPGLVWLARLTSAVPVQPAAPEMRPASNLLKD